MDLFPLLHFFGGEVEGVRGYVVVQITPTCNESEPPNKCETPHGCRQEGGFYFFVALLWRLLSSWDFNNSCAPFKIHTYKVAGSRPRTTRLKGPKAHTVRQISGIFPCLFSLFVQRYPFHLLLSPLRDGLLKFNLIPVKEPGLFIEIYSRNESYFIKISVFQTYVEKKDSDLINISMYKDVIRSTTLFKLFHPKKMTSYDMIIMINNPPDCCTCK